MVTLEKGKFGKVKCGHQKMNPVKATDKIKNVSTPTTKKNAALVMVFS